MNIYRGNKADKSEQVAYLEGETDPNYAKTWLAHNNEGEGLFLCGWRGKDDVPKRKQIQISRFEIPGLLAKKLKGKHGSPAPTSLGQFQAAPVVERIQVELPPAPPATGEGGQYLKMMFELLNNVILGQMADLKAQIANMQRPYSGYSDDDGEEEPALDSMAGLQKMISTIGPLMQGLNPPAPAPAAAPTAAAGGPEAAPNPNPYDEPPPWAKRLLDLADQVGLDADQEGG